jgi:hypothetical protein
MTAPNKGASLLKQVTPTLARLLEMAPNHGEVTLTLVFHGSEIARVITTVQHSELAGRN